MITPPEISKSRRRYRSLGRLWMILVLMFLLAKPWAVTMGQTEIQIEKPLLPEWERELNPGARETKQTPPEEEEQVVPSSAETPATQQTETPTREETQSPISQKSQSPPAQ